MISYLQAKKIIQKKCVPLGTEIVSLEKSLNRILVDDILAPFDLPLANNSAMDGFALNSRAVRFASSLKPVRLAVSGVVKAGDSSKFFLESDQTCIIMTGAFLPPGADSVLPKEEIELDGKSLLIRKRISRWQHVRLKGEEIRKGVRAIRKRTVIHSGTIAALATLGLSKVNVFQIPKISVIATGSELIQPGKKLKAGKIYDSNSWMIQAALSNMNLPIISKTIIPDEPALIEKTIKKALLQSDVILLAGGVSVGDYDWVKKVLIKIGVQTVFWKVAQKPGKPFYFGVKGKKIIFGLPGNPASVWTCFYAYVYEALQLLSGHPDPSLLTVRAVCFPSVSRHENKTLFLRGKISSDLQSVRLAQHQASHCALSLADSNVLVRVPPLNLKKIESAISVHLLQGR